MAPVTNGVRRGTSSTLRQSTFEAKEMPVSRAVRIGGPVSCVLISSNTRPPASLHATVRGSASRTQVRRRLGDADEHLGPHLWVDHLPDAQEIAIGVADGKLSKAPRLVFQAVHSRNSGLRQLAR